MSTITLSQRIRSFVKRKEKKNDDWARIEEPENFLKNVFLTIIVLLITGLFGALAMNVLASPDTALLHFAQFLHTYGNDFNAVYASFAVALLALINLLLLVIFIVLGHSDEDDVVEMLADFDAAFNERIAEIKEEIIEEIAAMLDRPVTSVHVEPVVYMQELSASNTDKKYYMLAHVTEINGAPPSTPTLAVTEKRGDGSTQFYCEEHKFVYSINHGACLECQKQVVAAG